MLFLTLCLASLVITQGRSDERLAVAIRTDERPDLRMLERRSDCQW